MGFYENMNVLGKLPGRAKSGYEHAMEMLGGALAGPAEGPIDEEPGLPSMEPGLRANPQAPSDELPLNEPTRPSGQFSRTEAPTPAPLVTTPAHVPINEGLFQRGPTTNPGSIKDIQARLNRSDVPYWVRQGAQTHFEPQEQAPDSELLGTDQDFRGHYDANGLRRNMPNDFVPMAPQPQQPQVDRSAEIASAVGRMGALSQSRRAAAMGGPQGPLNDMAEADARSQAMQATRIAELDRIRQGQELVRQRAAAQAPDMDISRFRGLMRGNMRQGMGVEQSAALAGGMGQALGDRIDPNNNPLLGGLLGPHVAGQNIAGQAMIGRQNAENQGNLGLEQARGQNDLAGINARGDIATKLQEANAMAELVKMITGEGLATNRVQAEQSGLNERHAGELGFRQKELDAKIAADALARQQADPVYQARQGEMVADATRNPIQRQVDKYNKTGQFPPEMIQDARALHENTKDELWHGQTGSFVERVFGSEDEVIRRYKARYGIDDTTAEALYKEVTGSRNPYASAFGIPLGF